MSSLISSISSQITSNIFSKVDTKNKGYIEASDLTDAINSSHSDDTKVDSEALFKSIDTDSDGKITKSEMSKSVENLLSQLNNSKSKGGETPPPEGAPPNDPPPSEGEDGGVTKEQATKMASDTSDTKLASMMSKVAENFEAADTNQDGKVSFQEAKAYEESTKQKEGTQKQSSSNSSEANSYKIMAKLVESYGIGNSSTINASA